MIAPEKRSGERNGFAASRRVPPGSLSPWVPAIAQNSVEAILHGIRKASIGPAARGADIFWKSAADSLPPLRGLSKNHFCAEVLAKFVFKLPAKHVLT
jgi:hypothetical protein